MLASVEGLNSRVSVSGIHSYYFNQSSQHLQVALTGSESSQSGSDQDEIYAGIGLAEGDLNPQDQPNPDQPQPDAQPNVGDPDAEAPAPEDADQARPADALEAAGLGFARRPGTCELRFGLLDLGEIRYNIAGDFFRAHCSCLAHGPLCTRRRAAFEAASGTGGQGRPLGLLVHWLQTAEQFASKEAHMKATAGSHNARAEARTLFEAFESSAEFATHERACRAGKPEEPIRIS